MLTSFAVGGVLVWWFNVALELNVTLDLLPGEAFGCSP
jgi:hypothetical protein